MLGALGMTTTMSMFRSGIFLMASFIGVAGLFILLSADLIGLLQIMMYIGGMLVMILFMLLFSMDPGGAMMAGMEMSPVERLFSRGLKPQTMSSPTSMRWRGGRPRRAKAHDHAAMQHSGMKMGGGTITTPCRTDDRKASRTSSTAESRRMAGWTWETTRPTSPTTMRG